MNQLESDTDAQFKSAIMASALRFSNILLEKAEKGWRRRQDLRFDTSKDFISEQYATETNLKELINSQETADIWFEFPNEKDHEGKPMRIACHRVVLSLRSDVFFDRFKGEWSQKNAILIENHSYHSYCAFIYATYTGRLTRPIDWSYDDLEALWYRTLIEVHSLAREYNVQGIIDQVMLLINYKLISPRSQMELYMNGASQILEALRREAKDTYFEYPLIALLSFKIDDQNFWQIRTAVEKIPIKRLEPWIQRQASINRNARCRRFDSCAKESKFSVSFRLFSYLQIL